MQVSRLVQIVLKSILKHLSIAAVASAATGITMFLMFNILNGNSFGGSNNTITNGDQSGNQTTSTNIKIGKIDKSVKIIDQSVTNIDNSITALNNSATVIREEVRNLSINYPDVVESRSLTTITERLTDQTTKINQILPGINQQITIIKNQTDQIKLSSSVTNLPSSSNTSVVGHSTIKSPGQSTNTTGDVSHSGIAATSSTKKNVSKNTVDTKVPEPSSMMGTLLVTVFMIFSWFRYARGSRN